MADTLREGAVKRPRSTVAPLAVAQRIPGHTCSRALRHHCSHNLCAGAATIVPPFHPCWWAPNAPMKCLFQNELPKAVLEVASWLRPLRVAIAAIFSRGPNDPHGRFSAACASPSGRSSGPAFARLSLRRRCEMRGFDGGVGGSGWESNQLTG